MCSICCISNNEISIQYDFFLLLLLCIFLFNSISKICRFVWCGCMCVFWCSVIEQEYYLIYAACAYWCVCFIYFFQFARPYLNEFIRLQTKGFRSFLLNKFIFFSSLDKRFTFYLFNFIYSSIPMLPFLFGTQN